nr:palindromic element RPE4 domain-containing protein [Rickettsia tamurae]
MSYRGLTTVSSFFNYFLDPVVKPRGDSKSQYDIITCSTLKNS